MATFGTPWPDARSLSVSFPTDDAAIGAYSNDIRQRFDQVADRREWQEAVLKAFQSWSIHANFNVGLVPDRGDSFGAIGLPFGDPRFGEIRVGAFPQSNALANALPFQPNAGTWSGDVLLNTDINYFLADPGPDNQVSLPGSNELGSPVELYSVLLHEAGNALGLADNTVPGAVMNGNYSGPNRTLKSTDIAAIRSLYGARIDVFEPSNNNTRARATSIATPANYNISSPITIGGSLHTMSDVDFYRFTPVLGQEKVTVRLMAAGVSLVKARLEILDRFGNKIADAKADSIFDNNLEIELGSLQNHNALFIRVSRNSDDVFGIGDYRIELDYRPSHLQPDIKAPPYDADQNGEDSGSIALIDVDSLFAQGFLIDTEVGANDNLANPTRLETTPGFLAATRYDLQSSIASSVDRDIWAFRSPASPSPSFTVVVDPVGLSSTGLEVYVLTPNGDRVAADVNARPDGGFTIQVDSPTANQDYLLFVRKSPSSEQQQGNYIANINFATDAGNGLREVVRSEVSSGAENISVLHSSKSQLFRFDLASLANDQDIGTQITIHNARTGEIVAAFSSAGTNVQTEYVWLSEGSYLLRATSRLRTTTTTGASRFSLFADVLSDDQGPRPVDPSGTLPDWGWEPTPNSDPGPLIDTFEPPFLNPWNSDFELDFWIDFYFEYLV